MDNLTHSFIGFTVGKFVSKRLGLKRGSEKEQDILLTSIIGNNLPDIDSFIIPLIPGLQNRMSALLHHRGYTHTFFWGLGLGYFSAFLSLKLLKRKGAPSWTLVLLGILSIFLHIFADFWNSYGVHPFSPFFNRWFYGDFIFIIEPLIYAVFLPYLFFVSQGRLSRQMLGLFFCLFNGLLLSQIFNSWELILSFNLLVLLGAVVHFFKPSASLALGSLALVLYWFQSSSLNVKKELRSWSQEKLPNLRLDQLVSSPTPGNPYCWNVILSGQEDKNYRAFSGIFSLNPERFPPETCFFIQQKKGYPGALKEVSAELQSLKGLHWFGEFRAPVSEFSILYSHCLVQALSRFVRVPSWFYTGNAQFYSDLRYDSQAAGRFATFPIEEAANCLSLVPPWEPPSKISLENEISKTPHHDPLASKGSPAF